MANRGIKVNDDIVSRAPGVVVPVILSPDGKCIMWGCDKPRVRRVYCRKHYDELRGKGTGAKIPVLVTVKAHWRKSPNGTPHYFPETQRIRYVLDPKTVRRDLIPWKKRIHPPCNTEDCSNESEIRGLCRGCYRRAWRQSKRPPSKIGAIRKPVGTMDKPWAYSRERAG